MRSRSFEELRVYILAEELADLIWGIVRKWDRLSTDTIGKQIIRAADSIGANIAEGTGRGSYRDNRRFVRIARGHALAKGMPPRELIAELFGRATGCSRGRRASHCRRSDRPCSPWRRADTDRMQNLSHPRSCRGNG